MDFNDLNKKIADMQKALNDTLVHLNSKLNQLPEEQRKHIAKHQADMNAIINCAKKGDSEKINEILKKNADTVS